MRIKTLTLKNFRSHQETVLELDRFNFIRGAKRLRQEFHPDGFGVSVHGAM